MEKEIRKPRILFINSVCGFGSTGRIVSELSKIEGYDTLVCYGRKKDYANVNSYKFANFFDNAFGAIRTILFDNNLNICTLATKRLIKKIKEFNPDIIHLHNMHGYYVNVEMLFKFLKEYNKPVVWTLHDCWPITGYCAAIDFYKCEKYKTECNNCPHKFSYPFSLFKQKIVKEYYLKKELFNSINDLTIVTPSKWLMSLVDRSYLKNCNKEVVNNGINLDDFKQTKEKNDRFTVIAVAGVWAEDRGLNEMNKIIPLLDKDIDVIAVGKNSEQIKNCNSIKFTNSKQELVNLYSSSHLLMMPTLDDNFPTVNIEALACGTPVITYKTGGSPEIVDENTGEVIEKGDYREMANRINHIKNSYAFDSKRCMDRAKKFSIEEMKSHYDKLYKTI